MNYSPLIWMAETVTEWPFTKLPETDITLSKKVTISLMEMSAQGNPKGIKGPEGLAGDGSGSISPKPTYRRYFKFWDCTRK